MKGKKKKKKICLAFYSDVLATYSVGCDERLDGGRDARKLDGNHGSLGQELDSGHGQAQVSGAEAQDEIVGRQSVFGPVYGLLVEHRQDRPAKGQHSVRVDSRPDPRRAPVAFRPGTADAQFRL